MGDAQRRAWGAKYWDSPSPKFIMGGSAEEKFDHPTQKPVELMRRPILNHTKRGESIYDPFLGSGTTLAAAEVTGRVCYGMEVDPKYVDVVVLPRITRLLALAVRFEGLLQDGTVKDYAELARLGGVSRARITQIMSLRTLAPAIQERILALPAASSPTAVVNERLLRGVAQQWDWREQMRMWEELDGQLRKSTEGRMGSSRDSEPARIASTRA
jgi:DNA methylase